VLRTSPKVFPPAGRSGNGGPQYPHPALRADLSRAAGEVSRAAGEVSRAAGEVPDAAGGASATLLSARDIVAGYGRGDEILKGTSLTVRPGEIVAIIGPNGAGKSTLLKTIAGLLHPASGSIHLRDTPIHAMSPREIARHGVAFVPQEANVFPTLSVRENLEMGGYIDPAHTAARIDAVFARFPMLAQKRHRAARTLSGGQRQVLAMAMALMVQPVLLLLDEPSAGLSPIAAGELFATIQAISREGIAIAMVEQNADAALEIAHRATILVDGRNNRDGDAAALRADPEIRRVFLGAHPTEQE
jgi:branched-chain amino acid transport system ATP-binding protein/neutral amino acid transport system ATP-binding protein